MTRPMALTPEFVEAVPTVLAAGVLYISMPYATAIHRCPCGCGNEVVTPFSPTDWQLVYDGQSVSLSPSVGNWSFRCRSHYWIQRNRVVWAGDMPDDAVRAGRARDRAIKDKAYGRAQTAQVNEEPGETGQKAHPRKSAR